MSWIAMHDHLPETVTWHLDSLAGKTVELQQGVVLNGTPDNTIFPGTRGVATGTLAIRRNHDFDDSGSHQNRDARNYWVTVEVVWNIDGQQPSPVRADFIRLVDEPDGSKNIFQLLPTELLMIQALFFRDTVGFAHVVRLGWPGDCAS